MKKSNLKALWDYISTKKVLFIAIILFSFVTVFFEILIPIQIGRTINEIVGINQVNFTGVNRQIFFLLIITGLVAISQYIQIEAANRLSYYIMEQMRRDLFRKIHRLPVSYIDRHSFGDIVGRVINDVDFIGNGLLQSLTGLFTGLMTIVGVLVMMLLLNVRIGLIVVVLTPISLIVSSIIANRTYSFFQEQLTIRGDLSGFSDEMTSSEYVIKNFEYQDRARERFNDINQELHKTGVTSQFYGALINPTARLINSMVYAAVGIFGALAVINGGLTVGVFTSFLTYAHQFTKPFNEISSVINEMQTAFASLERVVDFLDAEELNFQGPAKRIQGEERDVSFDSVDFSYSPQTKLIENFSAQIEDGATVAIVGPTGAGKSTLINLLMRFYELDGGRIEIGGLDIQKMEREYLRKNFGMVLQDPWIFHGTVFENITYGKQDASMEEVITAAKKVRIHHLIDQMADGYQTILEENGGNLSQGQKQLICITRIMLTNPKMLILDEATSSIDTMTEKYIQASFDTLMEGKTTFIVAHRLSTIENSDVILVMDRGRVVEQGSHSELLELKGLYYNLYQSQFSR